MLTDNELLEIATAAALRAWARFCKLYPAIGTMPKLVINRRYKTTAGTCDYMERVVALCPSLFRENIKEFENIIIPHELAHMVAWDIYKDPGHGSDWKSVMIAYGIEPARCHSMINSEHTAKIEKRAQAKIRAIANSFAIGDKVTFVHTNRQRETRDIVCTIVRINDKSYGMKEIATGISWRVPKENNCNLRWY